MDVDVIFERSGAAPFTMKVDVFLDTVAKIKAKIYELLEIPNIAQQTLLFQGKILSDDYDILLSNIYHKSRIQLLVSPPPTHFNADVDFKSVTAMIEELRISAEKEAFPPLISAKIAEIVFPPLKQFKFVTMMELHSVKGKAGDEQSPPPSVTFDGGSGSGSVAGASSSTNANGNANRNAFVVPFPAGRNRAPNPNPNPNGNGNGNGNGNAGARANDGLEYLTVVVDFRGERTPVAVYTDERVVMLRYRLAVLGVRVPEGPYFFVHRQDTMDDEQSFRYHRVAHGDEISVFAGHVTRGRARRARARGRTRN